MNILEFIAPSSRFARGAALLIAVVALLAVATPARADEADDAFQAGNRALEAGRWAEAENHYETAFRLRPGADIAANIAQAEVELGKRAEAAEHLSYALRLRSASTRPEQRAIMESMLADLKKGLCAISVETNVSGATITVDARTVGSSPLADPVFVEPGKHKVRAEQSVHAPAEQTVDASAGTTLSVKLVLSPEGSSTSEKPLWPPILLGGVAAVGLGMGIGFTVTAAQRAGEAEDLAASCPTAPSACVTEGNDLYSNANTFLGVGIGGFGLAGAGLIGLVVVLALPSPEPAASQARRTNFNVAPVIAPSQQGVSISGTF